jgi:hypothetical protein
MQKPTRHALAVLLPLIFVMPLLLSCGGAGGGTTLDGGYLGNTPTLEGPLYVSDKEVFSQNVSDGTITFSMQPATDLATATVSGGNFSQTLSVPSGMTQTWDTIMETFAAYSVSDSLAEGFVINMIVYNETSPDKLDLTIWNANSTFTTVVFYAYTDRGVEITAAGAYTGPGRTIPGTCDMSLNLKAGWNRLVMTRAETATYTDTWRLGEAPADTLWASGW